LRQPFYRTHLGPFHSLCIGRTVLLSHKSLRHRHPGHGAVRVTILHRSLSRRLVSVNVRVVLVCRTLFIREDKPQYGNKTRSYQTPFFFIQKHARWYTHCSSDGLSYLLTNLLYWRAVVRREAGVEKVGARQIVLRETERLDIYR